MEKSNMQLIKEFIDTCPLLSDGKIVVDYLEEVNEYSIESASTNLIEEKFVDGGSIRKIEFNFTVQAPNSSQNISNLSDSRFSEDFIEWIEEQDKIRNLPNINGIQHINCISPRLYDTKNRYT